MLNCPFCIHRNNAGECTILNKKCSRLPMEFECPYVSMTNKQYIARIAVISSVFITVLVIILWGIYKLLSTSPVFSI